MAERVGLSVSLGLGIRALFACGSRGQSKALKRRWSRRVALHAELFSRLNVINE